MSLCLSPVCIFYLLTFKGLSPVYLFICLYIWYLSLSVFSIYPCFIYLFICLYVWYLRQSVCFYIQFHLSVLLATGHLSVYLVIEWVCLSHFTCLACRSYNLWYPLFLRVYVQLGTYPPFIGLSTWHPPPFTGWLQAYGNPPIFWNLGLDILQNFCHPLHGSLGKRWRLWNNEQARGGGKN